MDLVRSLAMYLRKNLPPPNPVRIRRIKGEDWRWEDCAAMSYLHLKENHKVSTIFLDRSRNEDTQLDDLIHEWAHQLAGVKRDDHPQRFWIEHGKVYSEYLRWLEKHPK